MSTANVTVTNIPLSPMRVTFNGVDLGATSGGVDISLKTDFADITCDQFGKTVLDSRVSGYAYQIKFSLDEVLKKDNWKVAFPSIKEVGSGTAIYQDSQIGASLLGAAHVLVLHPLDHADTDKSADFTFYLAACKGAPQLKYTADKQVSLAVDMIVFPDTSVSPARFYFYGDTANGLVAASAAVPTYAGTGNGTCTSVSVGALTKSETITILCVGVPAANKSNWFVSGSLSGSLGMADITSGTTGGTVNFTSGQINFTLTDGTVDFIVGDQFQIVTTAANYT